MEISTVLQENIVLSGSTVFVNALIKGTYGVLTCKYGVITGDKLIIMQIYSTLTGNYGVNTRICSRLRPVITGD